MPESVLHNLAPADLKVFRGQHDGEDPDHENRPDRYAQVHERQEPGHGTLARHSLSDDHDDKRNRPGDKRRYIDLCHDLDGLEHKVELAPRLFVEICRF